MIVVTLATIFATDMVKVSIATKLKHILQGKLLHRLHMVTGTLLILIGFFVIIKTILIHHL